MGGCHKNSSVASPWAFPAGSVVKSPPQCSSHKDVSSISGLGRHPGGEHGNPLQCSEHRSMAGYRPQERRVGYSWGDLAGAHARSLTSALLPGDAAFLGEWSLSAAPAKLELAWLWKDRGLYWGAQPPIHWVQAQALSRVHSFWPEGQLWTDRGVGAAVKARPKLSLAQRKGTALDYVSNMDSCNAWFQWKLQESPSTCKKIESQRGLHNLPTGLIGNSTVKLGIPYHPILSSSLNHVLVPWIWVEARTSIVQMVATKVFQSARWGAWGSGTLGSMV